MTQLWGLSIASREWELWLREKKKLLGGQLGKKSKNGAGREVTQKKIKLPLRQETNEEGLQGSGRSQGQNDRRSQASAGEFEQDFRRGIDGWKVKRRETVHGLLLQSVRKKDGFSTRKRKITQPSERAQVQKEQKSQG